jgi:hypothetical protein
MNWHGNERCYGHIYSQFKKNSKTNATKIEAKNRQKTEKEPIQFQKHGSESVLFV